MQVSQFALPNPHKLPQAPTATSNWVVPGHLIIGEHPRMCDVHELIAAGVTMFVSLVGEYSSNEYYGEKYPAKMKKWRGKCLHLPVMDFNVPEMWVGVAWVTFLRSKIRKGEIIYVHCGGGHGRTGTVVVPLISAMCGVEYEEARSHTVMCTMCNRRSDEGWIVEMPETYEQMKLAESICVKLGSG
jgi:hypothetical protein